MQVFSLFEANPVLIELIVDIAGTAPALARYLSRNAGVLDGVPVTQAWVWVEELGLVIDLRLDAFALLMLVLVVGNFVSVLDVSIVNIAIPDMEKEFGESTGEKDEPQLVARCLFEDFGTLQKALEDRGIAPISAEQEYICQTPTELGEAEATEVLELIDKLEQDEDVQKVYHTLA